MTYGGPGFLAVSRQQVVSLSQSSRVSPIELTNGKGGGVGVLGEDPNHTTARLPGLL